MSKDKKRQVTDRSVQEIDEASFEDRLSTLVTGLGRGYKYQYVC